MADWTGKLSCLSGCSRLAMDFLYTHLPRSDIDCYPYELFFRFAGHALFLRRTLPRCRELDWEIFCHYVLFPRVNNEDLSFYPEVFYNELIKRTAGMDTEEAVLEVNRWCCEHASYEAQDGRTASPLTVYRSGSGRCGEESAFLVAALRSVGIAARQVYVPRWSHCDDNHAWVEALCGGRWRFLGACEPEPELDRGWFNSAASQALLVRSRVFGGAASPLHGDFLCRDGQAVCFNQTARYAAVGTYTFLVLKDGVPAAGAEISLQILNEASFCTAAVLTADRDGRACVTMGLGSVHVLAALDGWVAEGDCNGTGLTLELGPPEDAPSDGWQEFDFCPPPPAPAPPPLPEEQKRLRAEVLDRSRALRQARIDGFFKAEWALSPRADLLREAKGNASNIAAFLEKDGDPRREKLLRTLSKKDLRDADISVLEEHLTALPEQGELPEEIYWAYAACPRIALEPLRPWRRELLAALPEELRHLGRSDPAALWAGLRRLVSTEETAASAGLYWTPAEAVRAGRCDEKSLRLLYVAVLRSLGVPARLRPSDGEPEFWHHGAFCPARAGSSPSGTLRLKGVEELPRESRSLSRRVDGGWQLMEPEFAGEELRLVPGIYRLVTVSRLPSGIQLAAMRQVRVAEGAVTEIELYARRYAAEQLLYRRDMPQIPVRAADGGQESRLFLPTGAPMLLVWPEPGDEPTEHLLNELADMGPGLDISCVLCAPAAPGGALGRLLEKRPGLRLLYGDLGDRELAARRLGLDPERPPLAVLAGGDGRARYALTGYRVGAAELLGRLAEMLG